jgi:hypothetical protein
LCALSPFNAFADERGYVWTYEYLTVPRGEAELETYFTISTSDMDSLKGNTSVEHRVEFEVGMNNHFDFAVYQIFSQTPQKSLEYDGFQLRARYKIGEKKKYLIDPLLYLEYQGVPDFSKHGFETKLILAKDMGRFNMAMNPTLEFEFGDENKVEPKYALGMSYKINRLLRIGMEMKGSENGHFMGPVIAHGNERFWVTLGSAFRAGNVEQGSTEFQLRMLMGIGF